MGRFHQHSAKLFRPSLAGSFCLGSPSAVEAVRSMDGLRGRFSQPGTTRLIKKNSNGIWYPSTAPPTSGGVTLATLSRFRLHERCLLFHKIVGDTFGSDAPFKVSQPGVVLSQHRVPGHVFTHRYRLPELEGSVISFLGRIAPPAQKIILIDREIEALTTSDKYSKNQEQSLLTRLTHHL